MTSIKFMKLIPYFNALASNLRETVPDIFV